MRPLTVIIDEVASMLLAPAIPKGLPKEDPLVIEATELAAQKAILSTFIGKIARELRFVGVHLVVAMQRPDVSIFGPGGGEIRSNLTHAVQLVPPGKPLALTALQMLWPADMASSVFDTQVRFDDGRSRGLAVLAGDEGGVEAVRVAFAPPAEIPALLEARGVRPLDERERWVLDEPGAQAARPRFGEIIPGTATGPEMLEQEEEVVDIDLGDLDLESLTLDPTGSWTSGPDPFDGIDFG